MPGGEGGGDALAERTRRRVARRLLPYLVLLYFVAFVDRTNVSVAALGMKPDLGFDDAVIGLGAGVFFAGYFLLEIPGTLLVENWSARKWIARILVSWGLVATAMGFIGTRWLPVGTAEQQFHVLRFLLGAAEAGFFPGVLVYLSHWFREADRARAKAGFLVGLPIASVLGIPLSQWILHRIDWLGVPGWRWIFVLEGLPAVALGFVTLRVLPDRPEHVRWLAPDERDWLVGTLSAERRAKQGGSPPALAAAMLHALRLPQTLLLTAIYFLLAVGLYGLAFFLPSMAAQLAVDSVRLQTAVASVPYAFALVAMLWNGAHSDRTGERRLHTALPMLLAGICFAGAALSGSHVALATLAFCGVAMGLHAFLPAFWTWPSAVLAGSSAATAIGVVNSVGNLGGLVGPLVVGELRTRTGDFGAGLLFLAVCCTAAGGLALLLRRIPDPAAGPEG